MQINPIRTSESRSVNFACNNQIRKPEVDRQEQPTMVDYFNAANFINAVIPFKLSAEQAPREVNYAILNFKKVNDEANLFIKKALSQIEGVKKVSQIIAERKQETIDELTGPNGIIIKRITKSENGVATLEEFSPNGELFAKTECINGTPFSYITYPQSNSNVSTKIIFNSKGLPISIQETNNATTRKLSFDKNGEPSFYSIQKNNENTFNTIRYKNDLPLLFRNHQAIDDYGNQSATNAIVFENGKPKLVIDGLSQKSIDKGYQLIGENWVEDTDNVMKELFSLNLY